VSYELQPPSATSLKLIVGPATGGDTLWSSGYALYSSLSPGLQIYLEGLSALHSAVAQADGARAAGIPVRREPIETVHPVIRVHPVTGWKSVYVNPGMCQSPPVRLFVFHGKVRWYLLTLPTAYHTLPYRTARIVRSRRSFATICVSIPVSWSPGFTRRIVGVPKAESDAILAFLYAQISENPDFQVRFKWEPNDVAIWDNRVGLFVSHCTHGRNPPTTSPPPNPSA
jgi:sulfonate dioxygenase